MNSPEQRIRLELLAALGELSRMRPEWRLGQTVANLAMTAGRLDAGGVWDLEDDEALSAARALIAQSSGGDAEAAERDAAPCGGLPVGSASQDGVPGSPGQMRQSSRE